MQKIITFITDRIKERSTWLGLISCATALGLVLSPEQQEAIIAAGIIGAFTRDKAS